jgi:ABC-type Fe3+/spermidine/putrescine transport system ATPase subunit
VPPADLNLSPQRKREKLFGAVLTQLEAEARHRPGLTLAVSANGAMPAPGSAVVVSIRPQEISIDPPDEPDARKLDNVLDGRIVRHAYLGEARDYLVGVTGTDLTLRVVASARKVFRPSESVRLTIAAASCRMIPGSL